MMGISLIMGMNKARLSEKRDHMMFRRLFWRGFVCFGFDSVGFGVFGCLIRVDGV